MIDFRLGADIDRRRRGVQHEYLGAAGEPTPEDGLLLIAAAEGIDRGLQAGHSDREPDRDPTSLRTLAATMDEPREAIGDEPIQVGKRDILANAGARQQAL